MSDEARKFADDYGGVWGEHPTYLSADWRYEVDNGDTRASYWDWVLSEIEAQSV